jgi:hypothetical protein
MKDLTPYNNALKTTCLHHLINPGGEVDVSIEDQRSGYIPYDEEEIAERHNHFISAIPNADPSTPLENCFRSSLSTKVFQAFGLLRGLFKGISWSHLFACRGFDPNVVISSEDLLDPLIHVFLSEKGLDKTEWAQEQFRKFSSSRDVEAARALCRNRNLAMIGAPVGENEFLEGFKALLQMPGICLNMRGYLNNTPLQLVQNGHFNLPSTIRAEVIRLLTVAETISP